MPELLRTVRLALRLKTSLLVRGVWVQVPGRSNRMLCFQRLATAAMFLWSGVVQALMRGDEPHHSLLASV